MSRLTSSARLAISTGRAAGARGSLLKARGFQVSPRQYEAEDELLNKVKSTLKDSMRAKDSFKSTVIRGLLSDHQYATKAGGGSKPIDFASILQRSIGKRQESSRQFRAAKRDDLADKEDKEASFIQEFLPKQMPVEELETIVNQVISEVQKGGVTGKRVMGEVMKAVSAKVDKSRAPGSVVSEIVRKLLPKE